MKIKKIINLVIMGGVIYIMDDFCYTFGKGQMLGATLKALNENENEIETDILGTLANYKGKRKLKVKMVENIARYFMNEKKS